MFEDTIGGLYLMTKVTSVRPSFVKVSRNKNEIYRCGFPTEAMDKVIDRLTHKKISYCFCSDKKSGCRILEEKDFGTDNNFEMVISGMVSKGHRKNILTIECDEH